MLFLQPFWFCSVFDLDKVICDEEKQNLIWLKCSKLESKLIKKKNLSTVLISFPSGLRQIQTGVSLPFVKNSGWES